MLNYAANIPSLANPTAPNAWPRIAAAGLLVLFCLSGCSTTSHDGPNVDPKISDQLLDLPDRKEGAATGSALAAVIGPLDRASREDRILSEILAGNVPSWLRQLAPVSVQEEMQGEIRNVSFWATPDYLAVGSDSDYLLIPLTPSTAQRIADATRTSLPTTRMVDLIWQSATTIFRPQPIPPSPAMTTVPVFAAHNDSVRTQRAGLSMQPGQLAAGHKKDVVITNRLQTVVGKVAIYGWHYQTGDPIQPLYLGHTETYADYSHGIRLVSTRLTVNGNERGLSDVLGDPAIAPILSSEGAMHVLRY